MKKLILISLLLIVLVSLTAVSASENNMTNEIITINEDSIDETITENSEESPVGDFSELSNLINETDDNSTLILTKNYQYTLNTSDLKIEIDKNMTLDGANHVIDGNSVSFPLTMTPFKVTLKNIIFANFKWSAVRDYANNTIITNCTFINHPDGAIYCNGYNEISDCTFINCHGGRGGAIENWKYDSEISIVKNCNFINCSNDFAGGAIYANNELNSILIYDCTFTGCKSRFGGAVYGGLIKNSTFTNCSSTDRGGALYYSSAYNCNFTNCSGIEGAFWKCDEIINCTFENCYDSRASSQLTIQVSNITVGEKYKIIISLNRRITFEDPITIKINDEDRYFSDPIDEIIFEEYCFNPGNYTINVTYEGNDKFKPINKTVTFTVFENENMLDYSDLVKIINESESGSTITLKNDYAFITTEDNGNLLKLDKSITIDGNGHTLYFGVLANCENITLKNIQFKNLQQDTSYFGSIINSKEEFKNAMYNCSLIDCLVRGGGYISNFDAYDCTFILCYIEAYGKILDGNSINCKFINCGVGKFGKIVTNNSINTTFINCSSNGYEKGTYGNTTNCTFIDLVDTRDNFSIYIYIGIQENNEYEPNEFKDIYIRTNILPEINKLTFTFNNKTRIISQDPMGIFEWYYYELNPGNYTLIVSYEGDSNTKPGNITKIITIEPPLPKPDINISTNSIQKGNVEDIIVKFPEDALGDIAIHFNDNWTYEKINNSEVHFILDTANLTLGNHTLDIYFNGDGKYRVSHHTFQITIYESKTPRDYEDLVKLITESEAGSTITLTNDYIRNASVHQVLTIDKTITIDGNGHSLNFGIQAKENITLKNIKFKNLYDSYSHIDQILDVYGIGSLMYNCSLINCSNNVGWAFTNFDAYNCSFINCTLGDEINLLEGNAINCTFINCNGGILSKIVTGNANNTNFINCSSFGVENEVYGATTNCSIINHTDKRTDFGIYVRTEKQINENDPDNLTDLNVFSEIMYYEEMFTVTLIKGTEIIKQEQELGGIHVEFKGLEPGNYTLIVSYSGDILTKSGNNTQKISIIKPKPKVDFNVSENYDLPEKTVSEIIINFPEDATGKAVMDIGNERIYSTITNGKACFIINTTIFTYVNYPASVHYLGNNKYRESSKTFQITIYENQSKIDASDLEMTYTDGSTYTATVYGADGTVEMETPVEFIIDGKTVKTTTTDKNGKATLTLTQIPGTYEITTKALGINITKKLTVKEILTLKTIKIKKSAKSLTLTATLSKINGKYLKNQKITFKFNGKKYKTKTNKKGIAKVTLKKSTLKKLKVGKKITYSATYKKETVKKSAKIKK